jgi:hypothetical protein
VDRKEGSESRQLRPQQRVSPPPPATTAPPHPRGPKNAERAEGNPIVLPLLRTGRASIELRIAQHDAARAQVMSRERRIRSGLRGAGAVSCPGRPGSTVRECRGRMGRAPKALHCIFDRRWPDDRERQQLRSGRRS